MRDFYHLAVWVVAAFFVGVGIAECRRQQRIAAIVDATADEAEQFYYRGDAPSEPK